MHMDPLDGMLDLSFSPAPMIEPARTVDGIKVQLRASEWDVRPCEQREAVAFIESTHYAQGAPNTSVSRHALVRKDQPHIIVGVALWLPPTKPAAVSVNGDNWRGVLALSRLCVAAHAPRNAASFLLGRSMAAVDRSRWPTLLTYADTAHGHTGAIYLATNWQRIGEVPGSDSWAGPDGQQRGRKRGGRNYSAEEMRGMGFIRLPSQPKIKFVHHARVRVVTLPRKAADASVTHEALTA